MQIKEIFQQNKKEIVIGIFIFLIVTISFALGYLTATSIVQKTPIIIEKCGE